MRLDGKFLRFKVELVVLVMLGALLVVAQRQVACVVTVVVVRIRGGVAWRCWGVCK